MTAHTRFAELAYEKQCDLWRIIDSATGAAIGPFYRSKAELLADLERYATDYGCANASPRDPVREAAPDLLAALEVIEAWQNGSPLVGGRGLPPEIAANLRAAIAKATGSSQPVIAKARG